MSQIKKLCKKHTSLNNKDIEILEGYEKALSVFSEAQNCDVFIDCKTKNPNIAIVVSEARPEDSLYKYSVVGKYAERNNEPAAIRTLETGIPTRGLKGLTQENKAIIQNVSAIFNDNKEVIGVFIMERDETEFFNKEFSEPKKESVINGYEETKGLTTYLDDAIIYFNDEGTIIYANPQANRMYKELGYMEDLIGLHFSNVVLSDVKLSDVIESNYIEINNRKIGEKIFKLKYYTISEKYERIGIAMIINDMTDMHKKEKELILKSVAIKEIHHRVKNNLQTIASLLRLQARRMKEDSEKKILKENINRIVSIALTHEILAQNGMDEVSIKEILEKLVGYVTQASLPSFSKIVTQVIGDDFYIESDIATSVSLVVNELVQNSFEHGFKNENKGSVKVIIEKEKLFGKIIITDNGVGFDLKNVNKDSLGLLIVESVVKEKLSGDMAIETSSKGTSVEFTFMY